MRKVEFYCKHCDTDHGLFNARGDKYNHCPRCGRTKPKADEPDNPPLDPWNAHEMSLDLLERL